MFVCFVPLLKLQLLGKLHPFGYMHQALDSYLSLNFYIYIRDYLLKYILTYLLTSKWRWPQEWRQPKIEDNPKNEGNLKNEDNLKNGGDLEFKTGVFDVVALCKVSLQP